MARQAIVLGSSRSIWRDLDALRPILREPSFFAVNYMVLFAPTVQYAVSHHQDELPHLLELRARGMTAGARAKVAAHSSAPGPGIDRVWPEFRRGRSGSSALLATQIALALGFQEVILAGVELDAAGHIWDAPVDPAGHVDYARYRLGWQDHRAALLGRVTAVSGYLAELLGRPARCASHAA